MDYTARNDVTIRFPTFTGTVDVYFGRTVRKAVKERLIEWGGEITEGGNITGIPMDLADRIEAIIREEYPKWKYFSTADERARPLQSGDQVHWATKYGLHGDRKRIGYVGRLALFSVHRSTRRDVEPEKEWFLSTQLPGFQHEVGWGSTKEEAQRCSEDILVRFLERLGAELKET